MTDSASTQYYIFRNICHSDVYFHLTSLRQALRELKENAERSRDENDLFWKAEIARIKKEKDDEWEEKLKEVKKENDELRELLKNSKDPLFDESMMISTYLDELDRLNNVVAEKLIIINRLQNSLAYCNRIIFELEKSYALYCLKKVKKIRSRSCHMDKT